MIEAVRSRELERLKWRSRRGLLELDVVLARFWGGCGEGLDDTDAVRLATLLAMPDNDLLDLVMGRRDCPDPALKPLLQRLKAA
ncbi:MAG TPA: succinate dehydrogenase assembly factor 2 [Usitatibacteraceae bacterium]|nr:succinate dehydrogenase assembly factor 2 [Usitatibacteraceae bacterium]